MGIPEDAHSIDMIFVRDGRLIIEHAYPQKFRFEIRDRRTHTIDNNTRIFVEKAQENFKAAYDPSSSLHLVQKLKHIFMVSIFI